MRLLAVWVLVFSLAGGGLAALCQAGVPPDAATLRLVPFPKEVRLQPGTFDLKQPLVLEVPADRAATFADWLNDELQRAGLPPAQVSHRQGAGHAFRLLPRPAGSAQPVLPLPEVRWRAEAGPEDYVLTVGRDTITGQAREAPGLFHALSTLRQLIRANRCGTALPCLAIRDWPTMRYRCFQDDMTRGPSSRLETLQFEAALGAYLKFNVMTYYMEYQFAFRKHPEIGPANGSLTAEELRALVDYARPLHVAILGNQQSFGHFAQILKHPRYAPLRETADVLTPVREETYQLLDDLYS